MATCLVELGRTMYKLKISGETAGSLFWSIYYISIQIWLTQL